MDELSPFVVGQQLNADLGPCCGVRGGAAAAAAVALSLDGGEVFRTAVDAALVIIVVVGPQLAA